MKSLLPLSAAVLLFSFPAFAQQHGGPSHGGGGHAMNVEHGVGGGHSINEDRGEHTKLLHYLKAHESDIWIAPMVDVAKNIKAEQGK